MDKGRVLPAPGWSDGNGRALAFLARGGRLGLIPAMISVVVLPKLGEHTTLRLFLTGERFDARKALEYGLLHRVVADAALEAAVQQEIDAIAKGGPMAIGEAKQLVRTVAALAEAEAYEYAEKKIGLFRVSCGSPRELRPAVGCPGLWDGRGRWFTSSRLRRADAELALKTVATGLWNLRVTFFKKSTQGLDRFSRQFSGVSRSSRLLVPSRARRAPARTSAGSRS